MTSSANLVTLREKMSCFYGNACILKHVVTDISHRL